MKSAYNDYVINTGDDSKSFEDWKADCEKAYPQFKYWSLTMKWELLILSFVQSIRIRNFCLYKDSIRQLLPWFFALDHHHYAQWLSVHFPDMLQLCDKNPEVARAFNHGKFVVNKTGRKFSSIGIDHAHEQNNKHVKGDGGMIIIRVII